MNRENEKLILEYYGISECHIMTDEELLVEQAENCYVPYNGDDF